MREALHEYYVARDQIAAAVTAGRITWDANSAAACLECSGDTSDCTAGKCAPAAMVRVRSARR